MSDPQLNQVAVRVDVEQRAKRAASGKRIMKMGLGALVGVLIVTGGFWLGEGGDITYSVPFLLVGVTLLLIGFFTVAGESWGTCRAGTSNDMAVPGARSPGACSACM